MIKHSKFVKTAIAAAALGMLAFGAQAASISGSEKYAVESFAGSAPETAITLPTLNITAASAIPSGSTVTIMVQFAGGRPANLANGTSATVVGAVVPVAGSTLAATTTAAVGTGTPTATASNADVLVYTLSNTTTAIGIGGNLLTIAAPTITAAGLATLGATVTANVSIFVGAQTAPVGAAVPTTGLLEAASGATTVASSVQGISLTTTAGATTQRVNVATSTPSTVFSTSGVASATDTGSTTTIQLGTYGQVNGTAKLRDNSAAYSVSAKPVGSNTVVTVSAPAGYFGALGTTGSITVRAANANSCAGAALVTSTAFATKAAAAAATKVTLPATALGNTTGGATPAPFHVCMTVNGTDVIQTGAATIATQLGGDATATDTPNVLAATALTTLANNGAVADVPSWFPVALSQFGYSSYLRVVNRGAVSAPVSISLVDPSTGVAGTAQVIGTIPAGAATTFTGAQVEALIGAQASTARPRLRLTAPTGTLQVQSFVQSANGTFTEVSGGTTSN